MQMNRYRSIVKQKSMSKLGTCVLPRISKLDTWLLSLWHSVYRRRESNLGLNTELQEPVALMLREKINPQKRKGESTEAEHWGGSTRSSDEVLVMRMEQRGRVRRLQNFSNCFCRMRL